MLVLQSLTDKTLELSIALIISSGFLVKLLILLQFKNVSILIPTKIKLSILVIIYGQQHLSFTTYNITNI